MSTKVKANRIKTVICQKVGHNRNMVPSEIYHTLSSLFPNNSYQEFKNIVKEMQKDRLLIPDIIHGGLTLPQTK